MAMEGGSNGVAVFDIEADGLLYDAKVIHCIATEDVDTGVKRFYGPSTIEDGLRYLEEQEVLIGHNIATFDIPCIRKLHPGFSFTGKLIDTFLLSCMLHPDDGTLSLEDWTHRLGIPGLTKIAHEDWSVYTSDMGLRCKRDVEINTKVYRRLCSHKEYGLVKDGPMDLEVSVGLIHAQQVLNGVTFDLQSAVDLAKDLDVKLGEMRDTIISLAPRKVLIDGVNKKSQEEHRKSRIDSLDKGLAVQTVYPYRKDGEYTVNTLRYFGKDVPKVRGPYTKIEIKELNPDSDEELKELLLNLGWKPTEWNRVQDKVTKEFRVTSPKLTEDSYKSLPEGLGKLVAEFSVLSHRRSWLASRDKTKGAIREYFKRGDGRISAEAFTCGTPTHRYRHSGTVCNIPRPSSILGKEIRSLFCVPPDYWLVGVDLSGIEIRVLCHYLLRGNYKDAKKTTDLILSGDFHTVNAKLWGVSRDVGKSGLYATLYGAGAKKLATTLGKPESQGAKLKDSFFKEHPGIKQLMDDLERAYKSRGFLIGFDGRPVYARRESTLLNTMLQHTAAMIFKNWMISIDAYIKGYPLASVKVMQVISYHDELQFEVQSTDKTIADSFAVATEDIALSVGKSLGIFVPIEAKASVDKDWHLTH